MTKEQIQEEINRKESRFLSNRDVEDIWRSAINDEVVYSNNLLLVEFDCLLDGMLLKLYKSKSEKAREQISMIENMKSNIELCREVNVINNTQAKLIRGLRLKLIKMEIKNNQLEQLIQELK